MPPTRCSLLALTAAVTGALLCAGARVRAQRGCRSRRRLARRRLAQRLHDGPLQGLHALRLSLGPDPDPAFERGLIDVSRQIRGATEALRAPVL